jgi:hypothetical protein
LGMNQEPFFEEVEAYTQTIRMRRL